MESDLAVVMDTLGARLILPPGSETGVEWTDVTRGKKWTALFITAQHCRLCAMFLPKLQAVADAHTDSLCVLAFSQDTDKDTHDTYRRTLPFPTIEFAAEERARDTLRLLAVAGYPVVILFDEHGNLKTKRGKDLVLQTPYESW